MSFRTIVIKNRVKMEYSLNYLVIRGEKELKINLDEISMLIIQNISSSITVSLMSKLVEKKIGVIICDEKNNPQFEFTPYHSTHDSYSKLKKQIAWNDKSKGYLWKVIIKEKISNQAKILKDYNCINYEKLRYYLEQVEEADSTNREGHAAKVYFNSIFGNNFSRSDDSNDINKYLNYGYSILLSAINRAISSFGYLTQLGIHHIGENNHFNLSCDFVEPLRPIVDKIVLSGEVNNDNFKEKMISILSIKCFFDNKQYHLDNAITLYIQSLLAYLNTGDIDKIKFIHYES